MRKISACLMLAALMAFLAGCQSEGNYDELIDEYNENFTVTYTEAKSYDVDDYTESGDYDWLLRDLYSVEKRATTLSIIGPENGASYSWSVTDSAGTAVSLGSTSLTGQMLSMYIPKTSLRVRTMYTLTLSVTNHHGNILSDTGKIYIQSE